MLNHMSALREQFLGFIGMEYDGTRRQGPSLRNFAMPKVAEKTDKLKVVQNNTISFSSLTLTTTLSLS